MSSRLLVAIRVAATPQRAFECFTGEIARWWAPNSLFRFTPRAGGALSFEPGEGGRFIETLPNGKVFEIGRIRVWAPPERLSFSWRQAAFAPGQSTEVEVRFEPVGTETRVSIEHRGWDAIPAGHVARHGFPAPIFLKRHAQWWQALLSRYQSLVTQQEGME